MHEWPVLIFSLLIQTSVGLALVGALFAYWLKVELSEKECFIALRPAMLLMCIMAIAGLLASFGHLGYPMNAPNALRQIGSSWLSREILMISIYLGVLGMVTLYALFTRAVKPVLLLLAGLIGLAGVFCMSSVYANTFVIAWAHMNTYFMFFGAVATLGVITAYLLIAWPTHQQTSAQLIRRFMATTLLITAASVLIRLVEQPAYMSYLADASQLRSVVTFPQQFLLAFQSMACVRLLSWIVLVLAVVLMGIALYREKNKTTLSHQCATMVVACILVIVAESLFRYAFFTLG